MIKFIYEETKPDSPTFGDVETDQFFVNRGNLYQKVDQLSANKIADRNGVPFSESEVIFQINEIISKILPKVSKIEF